jgi:deoxyguanosine kinase
MHFDYICIEGNIGVGKTTLVAKLAAHLGARAVHEEFEENPWLPLFYEKVDGAELALELSFLTDRVRQLRRMHEKSKAGLLIGDYALDKCLLFAAINLQQPYFRQYRQLHEAVLQKVPQPSLVVVIHGGVSDLRENIRERNRSFEKNIPEEYLARLNESYKTFFAAPRGYPVLNIFASRLDSPSYEQIFREILAFIKLKPLVQNTSIHV